MSSSKSKFDRREFVKGGAGVFGAAALAGPLAFLHTKKLHAAHAAGDMCGIRTESPYGPLYPTADKATGLELIMLPEGFQYETFSWTGDAMSDGNPVPEDLDGMAVVATVFPGNNKNSNGKANEIVLIRNHEVTGGPPIAATHAYNPNAGGGTTVLRWKNGKLIDSRVSVAGTWNNCAGGPTPWGTWLTGEETLATVNGIPHGYIFESLPFASDADRDAWGTPVPLTDMGRFSHEAVAVDPATGFVYETEDESTTSNLIDSSGRRRGNSGFYKFVPNDASGVPGSLEAGGTLYMLRAVGPEGPVLDLRDPECFSEYDVEWIEITNPNGAPPDGRISAAYYEGWQQAGARFQRLEGCWWDPVQEVVVFVDTEGGSEAAGTEGAVWAYDPKTEKLHNIFVSQGALVPEAYGSDNPDNVTVSPRGGILLCEDGGTDDGDGLSLLGLLPNGQTFEFARNIINIGVLDAPALLAAGRDPLRVAEWIAEGDFSGNEWAGATFDPTGRTLFVNIQTPGITFAITGPWMKGPF
ncbi:MAG TPA: alkaline phosphatase PhoX [Planctomycetaceae bacterium]|nr:alkaline phosphatase PhoX [Planctomycetaceae bacterium]